MLDPTSMNTPVSLETLLNAASNSSKKPHILFFANSSWSIWRFRGNLLKHLKSQGYRVSVLAPHDAHTQYLQQICDVHNIDLDPQSLNPFSNLSLTHAIYKAYQHIQPDVVFQYTIKPNIWGSFAAKFSKNKVIAITTGLGYVFTENKPNFIKKIVHRLYQLSLRYAQEVWFLNAEDQEIFLQHQLTEVEKTHILPGEGVDTNYFAPQNHYVELDQTPRFILIARMLADKGIREYVQAAKIIREEYPHVQFDLVGPHDVQNPTVISLSEIQSWAHINYLGAQHDVRPYIARSICLVSSSYREGIPRTLLEGASMGKPLIASQIAGCVPLIDHGYNGFFCQPKDVPSLVDAMRNILQASPQALLDMGAHSREKIVQQFDDAHVFKHYEQAIARILHS